MPPDAKKLDVWARTTDPTDSRERTTAVVKLSPPSSVVIDGSRSSVAASGGWTAAGAEPLSPSVGRVRRAATYDRFESGAGAGAAIASATFGPPYAALQGAQLKRDRAKTRPSSR